MISGSKEDTSATPLIWDFPANSSLPSNLIPPSVLQVPAQVEHLTQLPFFQELNRTKITLPLTELGFVESVPELGFYSIDKCMGKRDRKASWNNIHTSSVAEISTFCSARWNIFPEERKKSGDCWNWDIWATSGSKHPREQLCTIQVRCGSSWQSPSSTTPLKSVEGTCTQVLKAGFLCFHHRGVKNLHHTLCHA